MLQVADLYAFIPREAISKFLSYCTECQRKQPSQSAGQQEPEVRQSPFEASHEAMEINHVPATPPATPPSEQESRERSPVKCEESLRPQVHAMAYAQACHAMQSFISRGISDHHHQPHHHPHHPHHLHHPLSLLKVGSDKNRHSQ